METLSSSNHDRLFRKCECLANRVHCGIADVGRLENRPVARSAVERDRERRIRSAVDRCDRCHPGSADGVYLFHVVGEARSTAVNVGRSRECDWGFLLCASLLKDPVKTKLQGVIRTYVEQLLRLAKEARNEKDIQDGLRRNESLHDQMLALVKEAVDDAYDGGGAAGKHLQRRDEQPRRTARRHARPTAGEHRSAAMPRGDYFDGHPGRNTSRHSGTGGSLTIAVAQDSRCW